MFTKTSILKSLMKQAYKTGLTLAATEDRYYIAGNYWELDVKKEFITRQIKACMIELAGELPEPGERFSATKDGNQMEIGRAAVDTERAEQRINVTPVIIIDGGAYIRVLQNENRNIKLVNNVFIDMVSNSEIIEENGEEATEGPFYDGTAGIFYKNNVMNFHVGCLVYRNGNKMLEGLEGIDLCPDA